LLMLMLMLVLTSDDDDDDSGDDDSTVVVVIKSKYIKNLKQNKKVIQNKTNPPYRMCLDQFNSVWVRVWS
jgi:hypothetical protein